MKEAVEDVKKDTEATIDWFGENQMQANPVKYQFMHRNKDEDVEFECRNIKIEFEESVKLLGINIDNMLKFTQHISNIIRKCGFQLNTSIKTSKHKNQAHDLLFIYSGQSKLLSIDLD